MSEMLKLGRPQNPNPGDEWIEERPPPGVGVFSGGAITSCSHWTRTHFRFTTDNEVRVESIEELNLPYRFRHGIHEWLWRGVWVCGVTNDAIAGVVLSLHVPELDPPTS